MDERWLAWTKELQSIAQTGLAYATDPFDMERYQRIRDISAEIMASYSELSIEKVKDLFCNEAGYQTPKIDTRAAIFKDDSILLVQENTGKWSLPGGWVDIDQSIGENTEKEVLEEAGLHVRAKRIIAMQERNRHNKPAYAYSVCKVFVECEALGGHFRENTETKGSAYFVLDKLPELAKEKNTAEQIALCFESRRYDVWEALFD